MHLFLILVWLSCVILLANFIRKRDCLYLSVGLAYVLSLTFLHFIGALIYLDSSYNPSIDPYLKTKGTTAIQTLYGFNVATQFILSFCLAYICFMKFFFKLSKRKTAYLLALLSNPQTKQQLRSRFLDIFRFIFILSLGFYSVFFILKFINIPSVSQIFAQGPIMLISSLMISEFLFSLGYELFLYVGLLVLLILFVQGFLSYSAGFIIMMLGLMLSYKRLKYIHLIYSVASLLTAVAILNAWLASRDTIREFLFSGSSLSFKSIIEFILLFFDNFLNSFQADYSTIFIAIDTRINLNNILGRVVENWEPSNTINSIQQLYIAFIPRLIWPSKPPLSGSTDWVVQLTNMSIAKNISVGLGHIAELYGNFGIFGVYIGAVIIAFIFCSIDYLVNLNLANMNFIKSWGFMMIGLSLVQPGGIFVKALNSAFITIVVFSIVNFSVIHIFGRRRIFYSKRDLFLNSGEFLG